MAHQHKSTSWSEKRTTSNWSVAWMCAYCSGLLVCMKFQDKRDISMLMTWSSAGCPQQSFKAIWHSTEPKMYYWHHNKAAMDKQDQMLEPHYSTRTPQQETAW